jgi:hypothetical protein
MIYVNLKRSERWPYNKVIPVIIRKQEKEENLAKEKKKQDHKSELRSSLNDSDGHMHVQEPSTATSMALTTYHNIPTDFISCQQWV